MEPLYMNENRFTHLLGTIKQPSNVVFIAPSPELDVVQHVEELVTTGQTHLQHEEYTLALQVLNEAMELILHTVHPDMPIDFPQPNTFRFPFDPTMLAPLAAKTAEFLGHLPPTRYTLPVGLVSEQSTLSQQTQDALKRASVEGWRVTSFHNAVEDVVSTALDAAERKDWSAAVKQYQTALAAAPRGERLIRGALLHDLAVVTEQTGDRAAAQTLAQSSIQEFTAAEAIEPQAQALATTAGIFARQGKVEEADRFGRMLDQILATHNFHPVVTRSVNTSAIGSRAVGRTKIPTLLRSGAALQEFKFDRNAPTLMGLTFVSDATPKKVLTLQGADTSATISLDGDGASSVKTFLTALSTTKDVDLLTHWQGGPRFIAHLPRIYFYIVPMAIGDCHFGMGNLEEALVSFQSALQYPSINPDYEVVKIWTRMAQTILEQGDRAYRQAGDEIAGYDAAKTLYEKIVRTDRTIDAASPLYSDAQFADIKSRVTSFLAESNPLASTENPAITTLLLQALSRLGQIATNLNFFGFAPDYVPPFSFEYLQNTSRYFAEHASQTEQRYIQYKSQAENEEFRRDQLDQQAEIARQSVVLEQRGLDEAQRGIGVASASVNYAAVQEQNAIATRNDFQNVRAELLELAGLEAWANASSVDRDDQVKLTISGYTYFSADSQRRNVVLQRLALQRTRISNQLEAAKLDRAVTSAQAYRGVAEAQLAQAQARKATAEQRVVIAQLQQRFAEENRDFLDMREFGARLWYELAREAKRIKQRYLDMATEVALLMERAYNAETERDLHVIRFDYDSTAAGNLMGADQLMADIESFTYDHVTTTRRKKIPVKKTISLADSYPMQFQSLKTRGLCLFETVLADFDREHPGLYLAKINNVELVLVGFSGVDSIAGTLRNIGVSRFRSSTGEVKERLYPADVMAISQYEVRQDALLFRFDPNELRLFENNGIETLWQLELPPSANDFDYNGILDVHLVLYYDGFFDPSLETAILASLPTTGGGSRAFSMKLTFPDELFYLKNQGEGDLIIDSSLFPMSQRDLKRNMTMIKLTGKSETVNGLTLRLRSEELGTELVLTTDAQGEVLDTTPGSPLAQFQNRPVVDRWHFRIAAGDNPALVTNGTLDLSGLDDLMTFTDYTFTYR